jgi:hypothetical protein
LWDEAEAGLRWDAPTEPEELLAGLVYLGSSLVPASWNQIASWLRRIDDLRQAAWSACRSGGDGLTVAP